MFRVRQRLQRNALAAAGVALAMTSGFAAPAGAMRTAGPAVVDDPNLPVARSAPEVPEWLPLASRQPSYDPDQSLGTVVGRITIPAIGVDELVRAGMDLAVIDQGPAQWVGTASPGDRGNVVLAGHRTTHSRPFHDLDRLQPGNLVFMSDSAGFEVMYRVTETFTVRPDEVWITYDNGEALLTMFACHPKGSVAQRIVVRAELVADRLIA